MFSPTGMPASGDAGVRFYPSWKRNTGDVTQIVKAGTDRTGRYGRASWLLGLFAFGDPKFLTSLASPSGMRNKFLSSRHRRSSLTTTSGYFLSTPSGWAAVSDFNPSGIARGRAHSGPVGSVGGAVERHLTAGSGSLICRFGLLIPGESSNFRV